MQGEPGFSVFLGQSRISPEALRQAWNEYLQNAGDERVQLVWTPSPAGAAAPEQQALILALDQQGYTSDRFQLDVSGLSLVIDKGCPVTYNAERQQLEIADPDPRQSRIVLTNLAAGQPNPSALQRVAISAAASEAHGSLTFEMAIGGPAIVPSIRFFFGAAAQLTRLYYPIFSTPLATPTTVQARIHPLHPFDSARTYFALNDAATYETNFRTTLGYPLALASIAGESRYALQYDPLDNQAYYVLAGKWQAGVVRQGQLGAVTQQDDLMCALSGVEYISLFADTSICFAPGGPAYAPGFGQPAQPGSVGQRLTSTLAGCPNPVTTSWAYVNSPSNTTTYYAQPDTSVYYHYDLQRADPDFLAYLALPGSILPAVDDPTGFPLAPYVGVQADQSQLASYQQFELTILSPERQSRINQPVTSAGPAGLAARLAGPSGPTGASKQGATPQGLLSTFGADLLTWQALLLAQTGVGTSFVQQLAFGDIKGALRAAFLSNQLFLVISSANAFAAYATFLQSRIRLQGWNFWLDPNLWSQHNTIVVVKFYRRSLADLAADINTWADPAAFNQSASQTQTALTTIIQAAAAKAQSDPDFANFAQIAADEAWNGILFLNCYVPLSSLPPQLEGLAAGIDPSLFFAHHLGFNISPVHQQNGAFAVGNSSCFGLIYYTNPGDLTYSGAAYDFKVLYLKVLFKNSEIINFSSQIELLVARLFDEPSSLLSSQRGDNLVLNGVYQKHNDRDAYVFSWQGVNRFKIASHVLDMVEITRAQFVTVAQPRDIPSANVVVSRFLLWGNLQFQALPGFDVFSFGSAGATGPVGPTAAGASGRLSFSNLAIEMDYRLAASPTGPTGAIAGMLRRPGPAGQEGPKGYAELMGAYPSGLPLALAGITGPTGPVGPTGPAAPSRTFSFDASNLAFDAALSQARPASLYNHFPLKVKGLLQSQALKRSASGGASPKPGDLGFMSVLSPLSPGSPTETWYGLEFSVNFGGQGALAAKANFEAILVAAWSPSANDYNVYLGLQLPGSTSASSEITIEGPLKLGMQRIQFTASEQGGPPYTLIFNNIALKFLGVSFPPSGSTNVYLFGDPSSQDNATLGWYGAYVKDEEKPAQDDSNS